MLARGRVTTHPDLLQRSELLGTTLFTEVPGRCILGSLHSRGPLGRQSYRKKPALVVRVELSLF